MKSSIANGESRGSVNNILLKALQTGDKYGYEINKEIETKSKGKFFLKEASLYSGLKRLEANGYITSYWKDGELGMRRHYYSITQTGLDKLNSSNFTWDDSKTFISEMFRNSPALSKKENTNEKLSKESNENDNLSNESIKMQEEKNIKEKVEVKKNPFQIEVNPLQQSIFDLNLSSEAKEKKEELPISVDEVNNTTLLKEKIDVKDIKIITKELETNEIQEKTEIDEQKSYSYTQVSYADLVNEFNQNSYSHNLFNNQEKVDISKYLNKDKENEASIVINKEEKTIVKTEENEIFDNCEEKTLNAFVNVQNEKQENEQVKNIDTSENKDDNNTNKDSSVDIKNIFGSLLVDEKQDLVEEVVQKEVEQELNIEKPIVKQELPRINVENDVNITLNANTRIRPNVQNVRKEEPIMPLGATNHTPSVKQYINNVHKKTLISRATKVEEEVNLDGINIREYRKMNNKIIKNSNYVYINKLKFFLTLLICGLVCLESVIAFFSLGATGSLGIFEILLYSLLISSSVGLSCYSGYVFIKDKFKVELKNYNFKTTLFYSVLIFVVSFIIFVCINIFQGMNTSNSGDFVIKIIFEFIVCFNIILFPVLKMLFLKLKKFSN